MGKSRRRSAAASSSSSSSARCASSAAGGGGTRPPSSRPARRLSTDAPRMVDKAARTAFVCQQCGRAASRWLGQCPGCGAWNALVEEAVRETRARETRTGASAATPALLVAHAKASGVACFLIGHVTKEGALAGPRVLEHLVDTVLYFEGDSGHALRVLRAVKNRFGSTNEVAVFEMGERGLAEVPNPSATFLAERPVGAPGSTVLATLEGSRPLLVEIQALVSRSALALPRRAAT